MELLWERMYSNIRCPRTASKYESCSVRAKWNEGNGQRTNKTSNEEYIIWFITMSKSNNKILL